MEHKLQNGREGPPRNCRGSLKFRSLCNQENVLPLVTSRHLFFAGQPLDFGVQQPGADITAVHHQPSGAWHVLQLQNSRQQSFRLGRDAVWNIHRQQFDPQVSKSGGNWTGAIGQHGQQRSWPVGPPANPNDCPRRHRHPHCRHSRRRNRRLFQAKWVHFFIHM